MDVLLTHGYFLYEDPKELAIMKPYPPLGILYLAAHLKKKGFAVEVYDTTFGSRRELYEILAGRPPSVIGVYGNLMTRRSVLSIIAAARAAGWTVVLGGPEPAAYADEYLRAGADMVVQGEGELTLEELLTALRGNASQDLRKVPGLIFRDGDGAIVRTTPRALIPNLDAQPWPDREQIRIQDYVRTWREHHGRGSLSLITARGCPYRCQWCSHSTYGNTHRRRSAKDVADEVQWLLDRYHPEMLWIADDVFTIHHGWVLQYVREMKERSLRIPFECITRADRVNPRIADALAELGCFRVWIGSESGSQRILDRMQRGVRLEQVRDALRLCRERGIQTGMFLMWGYEGEEISDIEATIEHVKATVPDVFLTTVSYPIKGTPYFDEVVERLSGPRAWAEITDRDLTVRGRRSREFYSRADQLLKDEVELQRLSGSADRTGASDLLRRIEEGRQALHASSTRVGS